MKAINLYYQAKKIPFIGLVHKSKNHLMIHPKGALKKHKIKLIIHIPTFLYQYLFCLI